ncbi:MAG: plasmid pRiA4b ORF-3 family protein [Firmicutes bacterium]|nr:plasmid pRiA4b ORF-3 family protein [Bacillota bacterium]
MKAYQIKISLIGSNPLIWRRVIMPAFATFNRLNDIIQNVTNFESGYPYEPCHLFQFDLYKENMKVTNDDEAYREHKYYMKNKKKIKKRLESMDDEFSKNYLENLKTVIRKPAGKKIDDYLTKYKEIRYTYDFGDNWEFLIELEKIVDDYKFGYPKLIDGANTSPPEDVGGIPGFYEFLKIYKDKNHPDHLKVRKWADSQNYREYDKEHINGTLKFIKYKRNEK